MSMIDYDARPVTPQLVLVGDPASAVGSSIRDFLSRNAVPYEWVDVDDTERVAGLLSVQETDPDQLPVCILPNGMRLPPPPPRGGGRGRGGGDGVSSELVGVRLDDRRGWSGRAGGGRVRRL